MSARRPAAGAPQPGAPAPRRVAHGPRIEIADLGAAGVLAAEYDAQADAVRVDARAVERVRAALGDAEARRFVACAVAHELHHRADPRATEAQAHAAAAIAAGVDPARFTAVLRGPRP